MTCLFIFCFIHLVSFQLILLLNQSAQKRPIESTTWRNWIKNVNKLKFLRNDFENLESLSDKVSIKRCFDSNRWWKVTQSIGAVEWKAQTNTLSYGGTPLSLFQFLSLSLSLCKSSWQNLQNNEKRIFWSENEMKLGIWIERRANKRFFQSVSTN